MPKTGRIHVQGRHSRAARNGGAADGAPGADMGAPRRAQLPGGPQEHQVGRAGAAAGHARIRARDARQRYCAAGADARQDQDEHQGVWQLKIKGNEENPEKERKKEREKERKKRDSPSQDLVLYFISFFFPCSSSFYSPPPSPFFFILPRFIQKKNTC